MKKQAWGLQEESGEIVKLAKKVNKELYLICGTSNIESFEPTLVRLDQLDIAGKDSFRNPESYIRLAIRKFIQ